MALFLASTAQERIETESVAKIEGSYSFRGIEFVSGNGKHVDGDFADIDGDFTNSLDGIGVEDGSVFFEETAGLVHRLGDARLVVRPHERGEGREVFFEIGGQFIEEEATLVIDTDSAGLESNRSHGFDGA